MIPTKNAWLRWVNPRFTDEEILQWLSTEGGRKMINRYPKITALTTKSMYADLTKLANVLDSQNLDCIPQTFVLPGPDLARFKAYAKAHPSATFLQNLTMVAVEKQSLSLTN